MFVILRHAVPCFDGLVNFFGDVEQDADSGEGEEEACAAGGDEGEWDSLGGEERQHYADVEEGLKQDGGAITGDQTSQMFDSPVTGSLDADGVHLMFRTRYEGATIFYRLDGTVAGNKIEGNVVLGSGSDHHQGPINQAQFGSGQFQAVRAGGM